MKAIGESADMSILPDSLIKAAKAVAVGLRGNQYKIRIAKVLIKRAILASQK